MSDETKCTALSTRVCFPELRRDSLPKWVLAVVSEACRCQPPRLMDIPEFTDETPRNVHRAWAIWKIHDELEQLERYFRGWSIYRRSGDKFNKPTSTKAERFMRLSMAWDYYKNWE